MARHSKRRGGHLSLIATQHPEDPAIESLRSLRTSLRFTLTDAPNRVIMIAGPAPSIGKSFVSANLAAVLAQAGSHVLLVDGDMRRGHLHEYFQGPKREGGLSEVLSGQLAWQEAVQRDQGLDLISTGTIPPNPAELLMGPRFETFLQEVGGSYDHVIIDAPPVLAVTDAALIGSKVGSVLVLLKAGQHPLDEILITLRRLEGAGIQPKGFIFNDVSPSGSSNGSYRYNYYYSYGQKRT
jgi:tyrosine-protein kinase Etk/Wzc